MTQTQSQRFKRRMRTYSGRAMASLRGGITDPVFFMHLPKCGGTSVAEALYATVPLQERVGVIDANSTRRTAAMMHDDVNELHSQHDDLPNSKNVYDLRETMLINHMAWDSQMIHGHVLFSDRAHNHFGQDYKYVTVLREPVARTLSNFVHCVFSGMIANDFDAYLDSKILRAHGLTFLRYFSGSATLSTSQEDAALAKAKGTVAKFSVVGFLDDLPRFCTDYNAAFGVRPRIGVHNQALSPPFHPSDEQMGKLALILQNEIAFWHYVRRFKGIA
jgi:hypothetical protein